MNTDQVASDIVAVTQLAAAVCFAPCIDEPPRPEIREEGKEILRAAQQIKRQLDIALTPDVRADIVQTIDYFDRHREDYRGALVRWVDLLDSVAHLMEQHYGDGTGPKKERQVRAAMYYILRGFMGNQGLPTLPPWLRPIMLEVALRGTIEFIVEVDKQTPGRRLWSDAPPTGEPTRLFSQRTYAKVAKWRQTAGEGFVAFIIRLVMPPPQLTDKKLKAQVDAILADWERQARRTGADPLRRAVANFVISTRWIAEHAEQVRAALRAITIAVHASARFQHFDSADQLEAVKVAVVIMFEDIGYTGPLFERTVRFMVDLLADAIRHLFSKYNVV